jgi:D-serine deaminase-like pyridoxal phosphate-dependent protein
MALKETIATLSTPAFLVDLDRVEANTVRMHEKASRSGVHFRPHVKTHKTLEIARMQGRGEPLPITVSTLAEAEFFADGGFSDITYAVPISPEKLGRAASLQKRVGRLNLLLDSMETLAAIDSFCATEGVLFSVFLKVDSGYGRAGVDPRTPEALDLARALAGSPSVTFAGLLTHAGHSYSVSSREAMLQVAREEVEAVDRFASRLRESGVDGLVRSVGSTPTASVVDTFEDCDEVRPGNYVFYDAFQATVGSCTLAECAASVVTTVIGSYPSSGRLILDAGALALSKDSGPEHVAPGFGYGLLCDLRLRPLPMRIVSLSQEHGKVETHPGASVPVGTRLRVIPNHSCLTAALFDGYAVLRGEEVVDRWVPVRGW